MTKQFKNNVTADIGYRSMYMVRTPTEKYRDCVGVVVTAKTHYSYSAFNACTSVNVNSQYECTSMYFPVQFEI